MPPLRRKQTSKRHATSTSKRKRTRSISESEVAIEPNESENRTELSDDVSDYPTSPIRDSILFDVSLVTAEFHPHTSRIILATTSAYEVAVVYLPPPENDPDHSTAAPRYGEVSAKSSVRRRICWLREQTQEEAREEEEQRRAGEAQPMEQDIANSQANGIPSLENAHPNVADVETQDQHLEAPGSSSLAS